MKRVLVRASRLAAVTDVAQSKFLLEGLLRGPFCCIPCVLPLSIGMDTKHVISAS